MADNSRFEPADKMAEIARLVLGEPNWKLSNKEEWRYGSNGSLKVNVAGPNQGTWISFELDLKGGVLDFLEIYAELKGQAAWDWLKTHKLVEDKGNNSGTTRAKITAIYPYNSDKGVLIFQVVRFEPKTFRPRRPDGNGGWIWNLKGVERVPYRLPEVIAATRVYIVEGEKAANRMVADWGVCATCSPGGANKWHPSYSRWFAGKEIVILPDNDASDPLHPGLAHARQVAAALGGVAKWIKIVEIPGLPDKGDIYDAMDQGMGQSEFDDIVDGVDPVGGRDAGQPEIKSTWDDLDAIPPRGWLLGTNFCIGYLSGLTGAGGTGKTALRLTQLIALALGRPLTQEHCWKRTRVLLVCLEDDENELKRRVKAACDAHRITPGELNGWLHTWTPSGLRFLEVVKYGEVETGGLAEALAERIRALGIGLVSIDPIVKSHAANENDNGQMDQVAQQFLGVAHACGCAADYVSHDRKGAGSAGDADRVRGASALVNASRLLKTLTKMTDKEADDLGVEKRQQKTLVRLDDGKVNITPEEPEAWFELIGVPIGNSSETYPHGDNVQAVRRWYPPDPYAEMTAELWGKIFAAIRTGPGPDEKWLIDIRSNDWVGWPICKAGNKEKGEARRLVRDWVKSGVLVIAPYHPRRSVRAGPSL